MHKMLIFFNNCVKIQKETSTKMYISFCVCECSEPNRRHSPCRRDDLKELCTSIISSVVT